MQDIREKRSLDEEKPQATCGEAQGGVKVGERLRWRMSTRRSSKPS